MLVKNNNYICAHTHPSVKAVKKKKVDKASDMSVFCVNRNWEFWVRGTSFPHRDLLGSLDGAHLSGKMQRKT